MRCVISMRHGTLFPEGRRKEARDELTNILRFVQRINLDVMQRINLDVMHVEHSLPGLVFLNEMEVIKSLCRV